MTDIREYLQHLPEPYLMRDVNRSIEEAMRRDVLIAYGMIAEAALSRDQDASASTDYNLFFRLMRFLEYDWIVGSVNGGQVGSTPWGCVGVTERMASFSATPLLSLWLSYFRLELGDERAR